MPMTLGQALERYMLVTVGHGCSDGGCLVQRPTGMHTNGGCKCPRDYIKSHRVMYAAQLMADAIDAHLAHLVQPAQSVDVEKVREVIAELRANVSPLDGYHSPKFHAWADKLTAALQENGNG